MGGMGTSRERIEERLSGLAVVYGSFPVDQTTVSVPEEQFERVRERTGDGLVEVRVKVHNEDDDILKVADESGRALPSAWVGYEGKIEQRAREVVRSQTGVECAVDDLARATIAGLRNTASPDSKTLYFLVVVLTGEKAGGDPKNQAAWESSIEVARPLQTL